MVFAKLLLNPIVVGNYSAREEAAKEPDSGGEKVLSSVKILTLSNANNGGGFFVLRFCANSIFLVLDFHNNLLVQVLSFCDIHGAAWEFCHIYQRPRHCLRL